MNNTKLLLQRLLILGVIAIGIYMFASYSLPKPPAVSGIGFILAGLAMWVPTCPLLKKILG